MSHIEEIINFLYIVDDYTEWSGLFLLKSKDAAYVKFRDWKVLIGNQTDKKVKALRTNNGAECGILRHRSVMLIPQQNGVDERVNATLLEKVRALLFTSGLQKGFGRKPKQQPHT